MHGLDQETYDRTKAEIESMEDQETREACLDAHQTAKEIVELFELDHVRTPAEIYEKAKLALQKANHCLNRQSDNRSKVDDFG